MIFSFAHELPYSNLEIDRETKNVVELLVEHQFNYSSSVHQKIIQDLLPVFLKFLIRAVHSTPRVVRNISHQIMIRTINNILEQNFNDLYK